MPLPSASSGVLVSSVVLQVVLGAVAVHAAHRVVRSGVAHGIRGARRTDVRPDAEQRLHA